MRNKIIASWFKTVFPDSSTGTGSCPKSSSSCRVNGGTGSSMGRPQTKLQVVDNEIKMTYTSTEKPEGCIDFPQTIVYFRCPERGGVSFLCVHCKNLLCVAAR